MYIQQDATLHSLFISAKLLYLFRVVSPPIIRSTHNCIYSIWYWSTCYRYLVMGGDTTQNMYSSFPEINKLCNFASCWKYIWIYLRCTDPWTLNFRNIPDHKRQTDGVHELGCNTFPHIPPNNTFSHLLSSCGNALTRPKQMGASSNTTTLIWLLEQLWSCQCTLCS